MNINRVNIVFWFRLLGAERLGVVVVVCWRPLLVRVVNHRPGCFGSFHLNQLHLGGVTSCVGLVFMLDPISFWIHQDVTPNEIPEASYSGITKHQK